MGSVSFSRILSSFFVMDCYVSVSRILSVFCYGLFCQYLPHSQFSPVLDCYVSILPHSQFSSVIDCSISVSRIFNFFLYWIITLVCRAFSIFSCNELFRQCLTHSQFFLLWIVRLMSHAFLVFSCKELLRQYVAHSQFSLVRDCSVSVLRILCFVFFFMDCSVSVSGILSFFFVMDCYVGVSRILSVFLLWIVPLVSHTFSVFSCDGLLRQCVTHSQFIPLMDCYVSVSPILSFFL